VFVCLISEEPLLLVIKASKGATKGFKELASQQTEKTCGLGQEAEKA